MKPAVDMIVLCVSHKGGHCPTKPQYNHHNRTLRVGCDNHSPIWVLPVVLIMFFRAKRFSTEPYTTRSFRVSVVSFRLEQSMTLIFLKVTCQWLCVLGLDWREACASPWLDLGYAFFNSPTTGRVLGSPCVLSDGTFVLWLALSLGSCDSGSAFQVFPR